MILSAQSIWDRKPLKGMVSNGEFDGISHGLSACTYDLRLDQDLKMKPGDFKLASTLEYFSLPFDLAAVIMDKSSWARRGLAVQNTLADPGFSGYLTLELTNHGTEKFFIRKGTGICQVVFHLLDIPTNQPYNGKYQNQERGPQEAR